MNHHKHKIVFRETDIIRKIGAIDTLDRRILPICPEADCIEVLAEEELRSVLHNEYDTEAAEQIHKLYELKRDFYSIVFLLSKKGIKCPLFNQRK